jgi:hypothetical protein
MNAFADVLETIAHAPIKKRAITNHGVLNEAYAYAKPSSFSRGMRIDLNNPIPRFGNLHPLILPTIAPQPPPAAQ